MKKSRKKRTKKTKKTWIVVTGMCLLLVALAVIFIACGNEGETNPSNDTQAPNNTQTPGIEHVHAFGEWKIAKNATCTVEGEKERYCSCGEKQTGTIAAVGHTEVIDVAVAPTCTQEGLTEGKHCSVCHEVIVKQNALQKSEHTYGEWKTSHQATCTENGTEERYCNCGDKQTRSIPLTEHEAGEWVVDVAATCVSTGSRHQECSKCQAVLETEELAVTDHKESDFVTTVEATCTTEGERQTACTACKAVLRSETIDAKGHDYRSNSISASCEKPGGTQYTCTACTYSYMEESGEARGHSLEVSGICSRCDGDFSVDMRSRVGEPLTSAKYGFSFYGMDGALMVGFEAKNLSSKTIKYAWIEIIAYNTVGDVLYSTTKKTTGPISLGENLVFNLDTWGDHIFKIGINFKTTAKVEIANIKLEYTDGTIECGSYGYSTTTRNSRLN